MSNWFANFLKKHAQDALVISYTLAPLSVVGNLLGKLKHFTLLCKYFKDCSDITSTLVETSSGGKLS